MFIILLFHPLSTVNNNLEVYTPFEQQIIISDKNINTWDFTLVGSRASIGLIIISTESSFGLYMFSMPMAIYIQTILAHPTISITGSNGKIHITGIPQYTILKIMY